MCTGDNRKSVACWLTENEYLLQLLIFVRNKIHNTYQMENEISLLVLEQLSHRN